MPYTNDKEFFRIADEMGVTTIIKIAKRADEYYQRAVNSIKRLDEAGMLIRLGYTSVGPGDYFKKYFPGRAYKIINHNNPKHLQELTDGLTDCLPGIVVLETRENLLRGLDVLKRNGLPESVYVDVKNFIMNRPVLTHNTTVVEKTIPETIPEEKEMPYKEPEVEFPYKSILKEKYDLVISFSPPEYNGDRNAEIWLSQKRHSIGWISLSKALSDDEKFRLYKSMGERDYNLPPFDIFKDDLDNLIKRHRKSK